MTITTSTELKIKKKTNLSDQIADTLREAIFSGVFQAGSRLVEDRIAKMLKVSKTPLREALSLLQKDGLIDAFPSQGKFVASLSYEQLIDTYVVRDSMETLAARLAAGNADDSLARQLEYLSHESEKALSMKDTALFLKYDNEIHAAIFKYANNQTLSDIYELLKYRIKLGKVSTAYKDSGIERSVRDHSLIIEKIIGRDREGASQAMHAHINNIIERMKRANVSGRD